MKYATFTRTVNLIKARLKKILQFIETLKSPDDVTPLEAVDHQRILVFQAEVKLKQAEFDRTIRKLIDVTTLPSDYDDSSVIAAQDDIHDLCATILSRIQLLVDRSNNDDSHSIGSHSTEVPDTSTAVRLPKIELKHFNGDPQTWISFLNLFDTTIHKNRNLAPVAKFQYLLGTLSGDALNLVKSLPISDANYKIAYDTLRERYHSVRRLTSLHLNKIIDLPNVTMSPLRNLRTFLNVLNENTQALKALNCDITEHNPLLVTLLLRKLDSELRTKFESSRTDTQSMPSVNEIVKMLSEECAHAEDALLHSPGNKSHKQYAPHPVSSTKPQLPKFQNRAVTFVTTEELPNHTTLPPCFCCSKPGHKVYSCEIFKSQTPQERHKIVKSKHRCVSCLGNHDIRNCKSKNTCFKCRKKHHSLLHFDQPPTPSSESIQSTIATPHASNTSDSSSKFVGVSTDFTTPNTSLTVLLATVLVKLTTDTGITHVFRALIDSCSQCDFLSERAAQLLGVRRVKSNLHIKGIAQSHTYSKGLTYVNVETLSGNILAENHPMLILDRITNNLPRAPISSEVFEMVKGFTLADPTFHITGPIDVLLGGALYPYIFTGEKHFLGPNLPVVMNTQFGYTLMGSAPCIERVLPSQATHVTTLLSLNDFELHSAIQRFWHQEEPPMQNKLSEEEVLCENIFLNTHKRDKDGKYVVNLPFKSDPSMIGDSMQTAKNRFASLENKFKSQPHFKKAYVEFMDDYFNSGHMTLCESLPENTNNFFLPHHGVLKDSSSTTKLRTVFDASSKTSTGVSLNDILLTGPKLQTNIFEILFNFRRHNVVFTCDIRQMYRMIKVNPEHQSYQMIFWRSDSSSPLSMYKLTTVTYGMNCSPFLALRTLRQLAKDEGDAFPEAAEVLKNNTYIDDVIVGHEDENKALALQDQLIKLLQRGGFELRKWTSNSSKLLGTLPSTHHESPRFLKSTDQPFFSILGMYWSPSLDCFSYNFQMEACSVNTKRQVLSIIAQLNYDPCGFLTPVTMWAKIFMQLLWTKGFNWDETLPDDLLNKWATFSTQLNVISDIKIPRALKLFKHGAIQILGFSDASEQGFSSVVYVRCTDEYNTVTVRQLISKSRVAPLKRVSLPRLELCGSHLLARLISYCLTLLSPNYEIDRIQAWCDSTIVLSWLQTPPYRLKTYVANRVSEIQELVPSHLWAHVKSIDNPADCASRGILPSELENHHLWWTGPHWLMNSPDQWPAAHFTPIDQDDLEEIKPTEITTLHSCAEEDKFNFNKFSSWSKLIRTFAYVLRFTNNTRNTLQKKTGFLSAQELNHASLTIFKQVQLSCFADEIKSLKNTRPCNTKLQRLTPFIDDQGIMRVGGRLTHSALDFDAKHQIVLPKSHHIVNLLVDYYHIKYLHAPPQLLQSLLAQKVWILSARSLVRSRVYKCVRCFHAKPKNTSPLMGDLPAPRTFPSRAFFNTGIDFTGAFTAKSHNLKSTRTFKIYICIFVCLSTKAVHFEITSDLSSDAFIAALSRFVSRRGICKNIYCDNGTNFVGANTILRKNLANFCSENSIEFHFNPPSAPHQGGLWEAAVKSMKYHLRRVVGDTILTLEEFSTITTRIEAILNSRPLVPLSSDPSDLSALTPGHFLIGAPLLSVPEDNVVDIPINKLKRWQRLQAFTQLIWKRWTKDYLHTLQQRGKWNKQEENLQVGDLVLVEDNNSPPLSWPLARIVSIFPGKDNVVRVVKIRTKNGLFTRPATKIFPLPIN